MLKLPQLERPRRIARLAEQPAAWAHYLVGRRRKRLAAAVPPAVFDPSSIASLRLWLRGDDIGVSDGLPVSLWADASGYGNDVEQITGMKQPTFMAAQFGVHSFVRFDGIDDTLFKASPSGFACATGQTIIAVMSATTASPYGMAVVTNATNNELRQGGGGGTAQWLAPSGFTLVDGFDDLTAQWNVWSGSYDVGSDLLALWIDGVAQGANFDSGTLAVGDIYLGSRADTYHWIGDIAEVLVFDDVLGATARENVEAYLTAKYFPT